MIRETCYIQGDIPWVQSKYAWVNGHKENWFLGKNIYGFSDLSSSVNALCDFRHQSILLCLVTFQLRTVQKKSTYKQANRKWFCSKLSLLIVIRYTCFQTYVKNISLINKDIPNHGQKMAFKGFISPKTRWMWFWHNTLQKSVQHIKVPLPISVLFREV